MQSEGIKKEPETKRMEGQCDLQTGWVSTIGVLWSMWRAG